MSDITITNFDLFIMYLIVHIPAFLMLVLGVFLFKTNHKISKMLFVFTTIYFLILPGILFYDDVIHFFTSLFNTKDTVLSDEEL